jgi:biofilm PGA synthesis N-glycosyltransferase PgaC
MNVSIVVPAHNEAGNIRRLLTSLIEQDTRVARIVEIVVVASGCTDNTAELAREFGRGRPGLHVHVQERREGKVAAINMFMRQRDPRAEVIVICSADLDPGRDVIEKLVCCLRDRPEVGMVGGRPVPNNDGRRLVGRMVQLLWELHHEVSLEVPKMGEIVAFRAHLVEHVSELSVVDEASIEDIVRGKGYTLGYVADALVTNRGPEKIGEYFEQRRRIARGHYWLDFAFGYEVATLDRGLLAKAVLGVMRRQDRFGKLAMAAAIGTEVAARAFGLWDARVVGGKHRTWQALQSTKKLGGEANGASPSAPRPRRLSARPDPIEATASHGAARPDPTRAIPPLRAPKIDAKPQPSAVDRPGKRP